MASWHHDARSTLASCGLLRFKASSCLILIFFLSLSPSRGRSNLLYVAEAASSSFNVPAQFVFGDSLVEAGNNDYLPLTLSSAKTPPFGIDFPVPNGNQPTGRFTNGLTIPDILGRELGAEGFAPPYLAPTTKGSAILQGVNYASGGGGILNETGRIFIQRVPLDEQIGYFEETKKEIEGLLGEEAAAQLVATSIYSVTVGANDFLNNYLFPLPTTRDRFQESAPYIRKLITRFGQQLTRIYNDGARKIVIVNVPPIGCTPYQRTVRFKINGTCPPLPNDLAQQYNSELKELIVQLNSQFPQATFVYADAFMVVMDILTNPQQYGFEETRKACCGKIGPDKGLIPCRRSFPVCPDRTKYFFWDPYHPTQSGYEVIANAFLTGTAYTYPMNIQELAKL